MKGWPDYQHRALLCVGCLLEEELGVSSDVFSRSVTHMCYTRYVHGIIFTYNITYTKSIFTGKAIRALWSDLDFHLTPIYSGCGQASLFLSHTWLQPDRFEKKNLPYLMLSLKFTSVRVLITVLVEFRDRLGRCSTHRCDPVMTVGQGPSLLRT